MSSWTADIESLQTRHSLLHGWGKLQGSGEPPSKAWLEVRHGEGGGVGKIPAIFGKLYRSGEGRYTYIDFVLYGALEEVPGSQDAFSLVLEWPDNRRIHLAAPLPRHVLPSRGMARIMALPWKHYFTRGMQLVRQGQSGLLLGKLARMILAFFSSGWDPVRLLQWVEAEGKPLALVIDHDLGGGANLYRHSLMHRLAAEGFAPILLSAHHGILAYQLIAKRGRRTRTAHVEDLNVLFETLSGANFGRVVFNNILSFPAPIALVDALTNWLRQKGIEQFLFLVHDHYCICPSWLLLNDAGKYCGIPDTAVCASCLPANASPFLEFARGIDIVSWRAAWGALLQEADEIRCFSYATRNLLLRAHAEINPERVSVVPHTLDHVRLRKVALKDPGWPVIGVIGQIGYHKGGGVVRDLANHIRIAGKKAHIVVIGTIEYDLPKESVTITGPYRPEQLPELLETHGVNVGFFPSIWPETFSYVTEEMITMGLPVLTFDLGAPGERVAQYAYGRVIPLGSPESILEATEELYKDHVRNP
ncbi:glycosyltransferase family 4 protein [Sulfuricella sp.]|uniref:glycosyltransferase family 4 protein n=1 Tax=Sulfuricella sp. TaxID=2099377 RepID=UPI002C9A372E|nr:glycosyltransferase family 4 protein [Sulfuricella sp.]HUX62983.1 glycosyltransferase family 4 protein [Sulfuricella sp.]